MEELINPIDRFWEYIITCFWLAAVIGMLMFIMFIIREIKNAPLLNDEGKFVDRKTGEGL